MVTDATPGVAIVGCGFIGQLHARALRDLGRTRLVGVSSRREDVARKVAADFACAATTDAGALVRRDDVDIVLVATSSGSHAALAMEALSAGKHVIVEKPMAMAPDDCQRMIDEARRQGRVLSVVSQRRFEPVHQLVKRLVGEGALGRLLLVEAICPYYRTQAYYDSADWRGTRADDGGALMNQAIHSVDLLLWLGGPGREVYGRVATQIHRMEAEDLALAIVTLKNGALATIMASTNIQPGFQPCLNLYGDKGTIKLDGSRVAHWTVPGIAAPADPPAPASAGVQSPALASHEFHQAQLADILDAIATGRPPAVTGEDGLRAVELVDAVYRASAHGRVVALAR